MLWLILVVMVFLFSALYLFADEITAYLNAKTEELKAQTELLRKEINDDKHD